MALVLMNFLPILVFIIGVQCQINKPCMQCNNLQNTVSGPTQVIVNHTTENGCKVVTQKCLSLKIDDCLVQSAIKDAKSGRVLERFGDAKEKESIGGKMECGLLPGNPDKVGYLYNGVHANFYCISFCGQEHGITDSGNTFVMDTTSTTPEPTTTVVTTTAEPSTSTTPEPTTTMEPTTTVVPTTTAIPSTTTEKPSTSTVQTVRGCRVQK